MKMADRPTLPDTEIEITAEMIAAGVDCFYDLPELLGPSEEQLGDTLKRAVHAMLGVRRLSCCGAGAP